MYDYGTAGNQAAYGQPTPPAYHLGNIPKSLPIALFTNGNDYLADPIDVAHLIQQLPTQPVLRRNIPSYNHLDPIIAPGNLSVCCCPIPILRG